MFKNRESIDEFIALNGIKMFLDLMILDGEIKLYEYKGLKMTDKPKHIMTRAEAIACFKKHMPDAGRAEPVIDFYVAAGMLEIKEEEKPIFELRYPSGAFAYKIWANGRVEGFNENIIVINRIPELIAKVKAK